MRAALILLIGTFHLVGAQEVKVRFDLYKVEPAIGLALEGRLIAGGEGATAAMAKLPEFIRQRRIEEVAAVEIETESGSRMRGKSSEAVIVLPFHESTAGLDIDIDPLIEGGALNMNIQGVYTSAENDSPMERVITTQAAGLSGIPMLICRWQLDKDWLLLVGTPEFANSANSSPLVSGLIYMESAFYPTVNSASSGRDLLASALFPCRSGQRSSAEMIGWINDDNVPESDQPGFRTMIDPVLNADGTVTAGAESTYVIESGGRTRLESGDRVRRLEIREMSDTLEMEADKMTGRKATKAGNEDIEVEEDHYVAAFKYSLPSAP
ncbi:MAG: hypothetical protein P1U58_04710 [Verrucomicrobiales bacterium]|nr:hypothetical protein [Verrucomicrobiales bacterium]